MAGKVMLNPWIYGRSGSNPRGSGAADVFAKHQIKIAQQTLRMPDAMVGVMGGPTKEEAREILRRYRVKGYEVAPRRRNPYPSAARYWKGKQREEFDRGYRLGVQAEKEGKLSPPPWNLKREAEAAGWTTAFVEAARKARARWTNPWSGSAWQGSRTVAFIDRFGKRRKGRIVMRSSQPGYWVLNMGGRHGTPAVVHESEIISGGKPIHKNAGRRRKYNKKRRTRRNAPLTVYVGRHRHTRKSLLKKYGPKQGHRYWRRAKTKYHGYGKSAATCTIRRKRKNRHNPMDRRLDARLVHWLTDYDQRQSTKKGYNRYALPQYFNALRESVEPAISQGKSLPAALKEGFIYPSRLLTAVAKGLAKDGLISASELNQLVPK